MWIDMDAEKFIEKWLPDLLICNRAKYHECLDDIEGVASILRVTGLCDCCSEEYELK